MLILDVGNTYTKWAFKAKSEPMVEGRFFTAGMLIETIKLIDRYKVERVIASWVGADEKKLELNQAISLRGVGLHLIESEPERLGLKNGYEDYAKLGVDRWLAMLGIWKKRKGSFCVVDAGTALTIDFVSRDGQHLGGYIIPGLRTMTASINASTALINCELIEKGIGNIKPGKSTTDAVQRGILISLVGSIEFALEAAVQEFALDDLACFIGGGDAEQLLPLLSGCWKLEPSLVLNGISAYLAKI